MPSHECIYCGARNVQLVTEQSDIRYFPSDLFQILRCLECDIVFTGPALTEQAMAKYYPAAYGAYVSCESIREAFARQASPSADLVSYCHKLHRELAGHGLERVVAGLQNAVTRLRSDAGGIYCTQWYQYALPLAEGRTTRTLYVGSGNPVRFSEYTNLPGVELQTLDINPEMCAAYREVGVQAHDGTVSTVHFEDGRFDLIFSSHVVEHFLRPREEMRDLVQWLAPGGLMVCALPDYGSIEWRKKPVYYDVPRHQTHLEHRSAAMMFTDAGLEVVKRIHTPYGYGYFQSAFLQAAMNDEDFDPASFADPLPIRMQKVSRALSIVGQSGNVIYYLRKRGPAR